MDENSGEVTANRLKVHDYLGIAFDFTEKEKVKINMGKYVERIWYGFNYVWGEYFWKVNIKILGKKEN